MRARNQLLIKTDGFLDLRGFRNGERQLLREKSLAELITENERERERTDRLICLCIGVLGLLSGGIIVLWLVGQIWGGGL
jgi:hypothetical protein